MSVFASSYDVSWNVWSLSDPSPASLSASSLPSIPQWDGIHWRTVCFVAALTCMREIRSSFISLLFGFSSAWSTDNASVKIATLPLVLLLLLATVLAASDMASVSARKLLENLPVGIDMVSLSSLKRMIAPAPPFFVASVADPSVKTCVHY